MRQLVLRFFQNTVLFKRSRLKIAFSSIGIAVLVLQLFYPATLFAGTAIPSGSIVATYNTVTGDLVTSGTYINGNDSQRLGYAIFINGANPVAPGTGSLDGIGTATMHMLPASHPVTGSWGPDTHNLVTAPTSVCVVTYDVKTKDFNDLSAGKKNRVPAGANRNTDNSYEEYGNSFKIKVINGEIDLNRDGSVNGSDDGILGGKVVIDGKVDWNGNGTAGTGDNSPANAFFGKTVINGKVDMNGDGSVNNSDDGDLTDDPASCTVPTITNQPGTIIIVKNTVPDGAQDFGYTTTGGLSPSSFSLDDDADGTLSNTQTFTSVAPGTYTVTETGVTGFDLTNLTCDDNNSTVSGAVATINLESGETVTCTYTNTQRGKIIVEKQTIPSSDSTSFDFTSTTLSPSSFDLSHGEQEVFENLVPGIFDVAETVNSNYLTSSSCSDGSSINAISVQAGETVICIFTNTLKQGGITIIKNTFPTNSLESFEFDPSWGSNFTLIGNNASESFSLVPDTYTVSEVNLPSGWDLTNVDCTGGQTSINGNEATIVLALNDSVVCVFTNTQKGILKVNKTTNPTGDTTQFSITASGSGTITGGGSGIVTHDTDHEFEVTPGIYTVDETVPNGWVLISNSCDNVVVSAGATETCTIVNTLLGNIIIEKVTDPVLSTQSFSFTTSGTNYNGFSLTDGQTNSQALLPGVYSVSEDSVGGWDLTDISCQGPNGSFVINDPDVDFTLGAGESITCTYTNTFIPVVVPVADLELSKSVNQSSVQTGQQVTFTITVINNGPNDATGVVVTEALPSGLSFVSANPSIGTYSTSTNEWDIGSLSNGDSATLDIVATVTALSGDVVNQASVTLQSPNDPDSGNNFDDAKVTVLGTPTPPPPSGGGGSSGGGPTQVAVVDFQAVAQKNLGANVTETIVVRNTGAGSLSAGILEVTFPSQVQLVSASPSADSISGNVATWNVPALNSGARFTVTIIVQGNTTSSAVVTSAKYLINSSQVALTAVTEDVVGGEVLGESITAPAPQVAGERTELPRTGLPLDFIVLVFGLVGLRTTEILRNKLKNLSTA